MSTIFVIRHAEKPDGSCQGIDQSGSSDQESLIPRGWQRAGALAVFFGSKDGLHAPDQIYAAASGKKKVAPSVKAGSKSNRPVETVTPLASKLKKVPTETYTIGDEASLVDEIVKLDGATLICWQHEAIPEIAKLIMGTGAGIPDPWPGTRFDVVWCFSRAGAGKPWSFDQVCQCLLAGDGPNPIA
jgi:broad specificity phosphatase PhoE